MKRIYSVLIIFIGLVLFSGYTNFLNAQIEKIEIGINGLTCSQCSRTVYHALKKVDGVNEIEMDLNLPIATIKLPHNTNIDFAELQQAIVNAGYKVRDFNIYISDFSQWKQIDQYLIHNNWILGFDDMIDIIGENLKLQIIEPEFVADKDLLNNIRKLNPPKDIFKLGRNLYQVRILENN